MSPWIDLLKRAAAKWSEHKAPKMGAALAYYTALSLAPLVIILLSILSLVFGEGLARKELTSQVFQLMGQSGASTIAPILQSSASKTSGIIGMAIGFITLLFGASGVFGELQDSLNRIWEVPPRTGDTFWATIKSRFLSFAMVFVIGFLLLVSLIISTAISGASQYLSHFTPGLEIVWQLLNMAVSFVVVSLLFAIIFRVLPDTKISWHDVWLGGALTALLFTIGKFLLGLYLGHAAIGSSYGAAGSLIVMLVWVYYAAQILFFGAEFTWVYSERRKTQKSQPPPDGNTP